MFNNTNKQNRVPVFLLSHRVSGKFKRGTYFKLDMLQTEDGQVLKPIHKSNETNFYNRLFLSDTSKLSQEDIELKKFVPNYHGYLEVIEKMACYETIGYIIIDDIAHGLGYPAILDFKCGFDGRRGFYICGMRVFNKKDATFWRTCNEHLINRYDFVKKDSLALFYQFHETPQLRAIKETRKQLREIESWLLVQKSYSLYSTSIIVAYDAFLEDITNDCINASPEDVEKVIASLVRVKLVDFERHNHNHKTEEAIEIDHRFIRDIGEIIDFLYEILQPSFSFINFASNIGDLKAKESFYSTGVSEDNEIFYKIKIQIENKLAELRNQKRFGDEDNVLSSSDSGSENDTS